MIMITMVKICVWPSYGSSQSVEWIDLFNSSFANYWWKITQACDIGWSSSLKFVSEKCVWQLYCKYYYTTFNSACQGIEPKTSSLFLPLHTDMGSLIGNTKCGNFVLFLLFRFDVKSKLVSLKPQKLPFWPFE